MSHKLVQCPACEQHIGSNSAARINNYLEYSCQSCEVDLYRSEDFSSVDSNIYQGDVDYKNDLLIAGNWEDLLQWNHQKALDYIEKLPEYSRIVDIGTYNGFFVKVLMDLGYDAYGVDFNNEAISYGHDVYGLRSRLATSLDGHSPGTFNVVTAFEVIEHLMEPEKLLEDARELLCENGLLILSCPNRNMSWRPPLDRPPHHLSRFSPKSLDKMMQRYGYEVLAHSEQVSCFDLIRNYMGTYFRDSSQDSLRGGSFKNLEKANKIKRWLNHTRKTWLVLFTPLDMCMRWLGFRYISQVIVARKSRQ